MLQSQTNIQMQQIFDLIYPVGSLYFSTSLNTVDKVQAKFGGTWEKLPEGYAIWTASSEAGTFIQKGLPHMKATIHGLLFKQKISMNQGPFSVYFSDTEEGTVIGGFGSGGKAYQGTLDFDTARNNTNNIYRYDVKTVQPPAYKVYVYRRTALSGGGT